MQSDNTTYTTPVVSVVDSTAPQQDTTKQVDSATVKEEEETAVMKTPAQLPAEFGVEKTATPKKKKHLQIPKKQLLIPIRKAMTDFDMLKEGE